MKDIFLFLILGVCLLLVPFGSCSDSDPQKAPVLPYDPNKPVEVFSFSPDSGGMREKCIIKGSNFGNDVAKLQVIFNENRSAKIIATNGSMIYCIIPKQAGGLNKVEVVVEKDTARFQNKKFNYLIKELVTTTTGKSNLDNMYVDGTLAESRYHWITGVGYLTGNNLILCERFANRIRMASVDDNKVITLLTGVEAGTPAITKDYKTAYVVTFGRPHAIYSFEQRNLWLPRKIVDDLPGYNGHIQSIVLDPEEKWIYFRDSEAKFGRIEIANTNNIQLLNTNVGVTDNNTVHHLVYHPQMNCFLMSLENGGGIYKISMDGKTVEHYAGFNGAGNTEGDRLSAASFTTPMGMEVDKEGNIYVAQVRGHNIRKISYPEGLVSSITGTYGVAGLTDGAPNTALYNGPWDITLDHEDNFYISQFWGASVRKLAIE